MRLWGGYRKKRREKKKLEESEFAEALAADEAERPLAADLDVPETALSKSLPPCLLGQQPS